MRHLIRRAILAFSLAAAVTSLAIPAASASPIRPASSMAFQPGTSNAFHIYTVNGFQLCVDVNQFGAGHPVIQHLTCAGVYEHFVTNDQNNFPEYRLSLDQPASTYMAATNDCTKVTQKGDPNANGTVWTFYTNSAGNLYLAPRFCNPIGSYAVQMGSDNSPGDQWLVSADTSLYRSLNVIPAGA